ncbi:hypothetical protein HK097_004767 [Rhizophlyctis rosea]|uniref:Derlin n=1 Tax=Rhizophlyctis rosea TaxID=64517 RepID=A0AAD5SH58_9FUNG|nr:hypothetical protein HK097_004767 [Rhizophlyctis rosea]
MPIPLEEWYYEVPVITRTFITAVMMTTLGCKLKLINSFNLFYNWELVWRSGQYWRLVSSFLYFGDLSVDFFFHLFFLSRYSRMLEENSFRGRTADYFWMLFISMVSMLVIVPLLPAKIVIPFLSSPLTFLLVYVWSRRNPFIRMNFLGIFNFNAPYLPWVLLGFTILLHNHIPYGDMLGLAIGHVYYYLEDVYPRMAESRGRRLLATPSFVKMLFEDWGHGRGDAAFAAADAGLQPDAPPAQDAAPAAAPLVPEPAAPAAPAGGVGEQVLGGGDTAGGAGGSGLRQRVVDTSVVDNAQGAD